MPEQASQRALPITTAPIENPFETLIYPYGKGGLNIKDQPIAIPVGQFQQHTNVTHSNDGGLTSRPGATSLATLGTNHHTARRLHDVQGTETRIWGVDTNLGYGLSGALTVIDSGYSGDPLYLLPHRPPLSGDPWMFVADRFKMRKVRADGTVTLIGLPQATLSTTAIGATDLARVALMKTSDGSNAATWIPFEILPVPFPGQFTGGILITVADVAGPNSIGAVQFGTAGILLSAPLESYTFGIAHQFGFPKNLSFFDSTATPVADEDIFHCFLNIDRPDLIEEIRIYLVVGGPTVIQPAPYYDSAKLNNFSLPGQGIGNFSPSAYMLAFRPNDYQTALQSQETIQDAADRVRTAAFLETYVDPTIAHDATSPSYENLTGGVWAEFGAVNVPTTRRGDFVKIGAAGQAGTDWTNVTGMYIACQTKQVPGNYGLKVNVGISDVYFSGGFGPDTGAVGAQKYDYRVTNYDPRTGAEGNPSPIQSGALGAASTTPDLTLDVLRSAVLVQPLAYGDANIRQRVYRRGGSNIADWFFVGANTSDGAQFIDTQSDDAIALAGTLNLDHYQPVPTVDDNGNTVLAQPVACLFGPANGLLFALGDPYRPGHLYWCIPDEPDHWPAESNFEVCSPSEELMAGFMVGAQPFCFSRERLFAIYPSLSSTTEVTVTTTPCKRGIVSRWAVAVGMGGVFGVSKDAIFFTWGSVETVISQEIEKIFRGQVWNGYNPVDFTVPTAIRLGIFEDRLYFTYQGTDAHRHTLVYSLLYKFWSDYEFGFDEAHCTPDDDTAIANLLIGGGATGKTYLLSGTSDDGAAITCTVKTADWDLGRAREDKLLGDQIFMLDTGGIILNVINRLNDGTVVNGTNSITAAAGRGRVTIDGFGTTPQRARNISTEVNWSSSSGQPVLYFMGLSIIPEPDQTMNRVTQWDDLGHPDESYVTGITLDCDTGNAPILVHCERDFAQTITSMDDIIVTTPGRRKIKFSWPALPANKVRLRPDNTCAPWILYRADWISVPEPPRIAGWDIHFEADGDQYYTGLDLYCDTGGQEKLIQIQVDGVVLINPYTSEAFWRVTTTTRTWFHLTLPWGRGHVFHFVALDANPGLLYRHKWYLIPEPSEQANWNAAFSNEGTLADKWFKGCLFEVDTFGVAKNVNIEVDQVPVVTLPVKTSGRTIVHLAFPRVMGRILRVFPTDGNKSRPYTVQPIFDTEPYQLTRWETQETDHDQPGFQVPIEAQITLRSTLPVTLQLVTYINQLGTIVTDTYTIPPTLGVKDKKYVPFLARKGVLFRYIFSCTQPFHLFREESSVIIQPWGSDQPLMKKPFGDDDLDVTRPMVVASTAAERPGGGSV